MSEKSEKCKNECVQVVVRCRPMNKKEISRGCENVLDIQPSRGVVEIFSPKDDDRSNGKMFTFDAVYDSKCSQEDVYNLSIRPLVDSVLTGFNCTIFAYGQTGTGKTFTMEGIANDLTFKGIIPRSFEQIYSHISRTANTTFLVRASYLEIYQEEIRDLLDPSTKKKCELREHMDTGVYVKDLKSFVCKSVNEIESLMNSGNKNRTIGATNMNEHSSRSHAIFIVTIEMSEMDTSGLENQVRVGKLNLVDLAGSERQSKTASVGTRLKEASKINLSLSALGNVISALVDGKGQYIPYRDSKLTRLLQDSLGGNSKTLMIANIGPASYNYEETLTTLRYANRAKNIKNQPRINEDPKDALLRQFQEEIKRLKSLLNDQANKSAEIINKKKRRRKQDGGGDEADVEPVIEKTHQQLLIEEEANLDLKEKKLLNEDSDMTEKERNHLLQEIEEKKALIAREKKSSEDLATRLKAMESKLLMGGKNIIDHTNEQQKALEQRRDEINERKRREIQMEQMLYLKEESMEGVRETYTNLQQEVEAKNSKVRKLYQKLQNVRQEIQDITEVFNRERRELESNHNDLLKYQKLRVLIIENFIPPEERKRLSLRAFYDDEEDVWKVMPESDTELPLDRMVATPAERRPITEYARTARAVGLNTRYKGENILDLELEMPSPTTEDYQAPTVAPTVLSALEQALKGEEDICLDASVTSNKPRKPYTARPPTKPNYPKSRGLVPK